MYRRGWGGVEGDGGILYTLNTTGSRETRGGGGGVDTLLYGVRCAFFVRRHHCAC